LGKSHAAQRLWWYAEKMGSLKKPLLQRTYLA